jgi:hypothetical protein
MRTSLILAAAGLAVCVVVAAPTGLASADSAQDTIRALESQGYTVNIDRVGSGALDHCAVTSVRNPNTVTQLIRIGDRRRGSSDLVPIIVSKTVQVSLYCVT